MKKLSEANLRIGDIILTTTSLPVSKGIRLATKSDISHAMVYVEGYSVIDSTGEGVQSSNTQRMFWDDRLAVHVLRLKEGLTDEEAQRITSYVRGRIGTQYSTLEAMRSVTRGAKRKTRKQFCSRLVAQAYASAGIQLAPSPDFCTPEMLRNSPRLCEVSNATRPISTAEIDTINAILDIPALMREVTNALLTGAREKDRNIQNLNDIDDYLKAHPEDDPYFSKLFNESGYLSLWAKEREKNLWHYDLALMESSGLPDSEKRSYCEQLVHDGEKGFQRYGVNHAGYTIFAEQFELETFRLLKDLYQTLAELHLQRRSVAESWLSRHAPSSLKSLKKHQPLVPHSPSWFAALEAWNPQQAAHTRGVLKRLDRDDVCSVCGDDPARDYRVVGQDIPLDAVLTLRLCNDCWGLRGSMYKESLSLL